MKNLPLTYKVFALFGVMIFFVSHAFCVGEAGTYFNIFVPPNNKRIGRDVAVIVTAMENNTSFRITDTNEDGDNDDSWQIPRYSMATLVKIRDNTNGTGRWMITGPGLTPNWW